jgi:hypothetical protein
MALGHDKDRSRERLRNAQQIGHAPSPVVFLRYIHRKNRQTRPEAATSPFELTPPPFSPISQPFARLTGARSIFAPVAAPDPVSFLSAETSAEEGAFHPRAAGERGFFGPERAPIPVLVPFRIRGLT